MGLEDFQQRVVLFTLYSRVGYFHLNECVWIAAGLGYLIFRHTCVSVYSTSFSCILYLPAWIYSICTDLIKLCMCVFLMCVCVCTCMSAYVIKMLKTCMHLCQGVFMSIVFIAYLLSKFKEMVEILSHAKLNFGLSI